MPASKTIGLFLSLSLALSSASASTPTNDDPWFSLCGEIQDSQGAVIEGVEIRLTAFDENSKLDPNWHSPNILTDSNGGFCFEIDPPATHSFRLLFQKSGFIVSAIYVDSLGTNGSTELDLGVIELEKGHVYTGKVLPPDTSLPLSAWEVEIRAQIPLPKKNSYFFGSGNLDLTTGEFTIPDLPIEAEFASIQIWGRNIQTIAGIAIDPNETDPKKREFQLVARKLWSFVEPAFGTDWFSLCGEVHDADQQSALASVQVSIYGSSKGSSTLAAYGRVIEWEEIETLTDSEGKFCKSFDPPVPYEFSVMVEKAGFVSQKFNFDQLGWFSDSLDLGTVELRESGTFRGKLLSPDLSTPLEDLGQLEVFGRVRTNTLGETAVHREYGTIDWTTGEFTIPSLPMDGELATLAIYSDRTKSFTGVAIDPNDDSIPEFQLEFAPLVKPHSIVWIMPHGFTLKDKSAVSIDGTPLSEIDTGTLAPGPHLITINDSRFKLAPTQNALIDWQGGRLGIKLEFSSELELRVTDEVTGEEISEYGLSFTYNGYLYPRHLIGDPLPPNSIFDKLPASDSTLIIKADGYSPKLLELDGTPSGPVEVMLNKTSGKISGKVVFPDGTAATGALIRTFRKNYLRRRYIDENPDYIDNEIFNLQNTFKHEGHILKFEWTEADTLGNFAFESLADGEFDLRVYVKESEFLQHGGDPTHPTHLGFVELVVDPALTLPNTDGGRDIQLDIELP